MNTPRPCDASDTAINRLFSDEPPRPKVVPCSVDHPLAKWLYRHFKPGSDILTKAKAYELADELNRLLDRVEELERRLGLPQGPAELDDDGASL